MKPPYRRSRRSRFDCEEESMWFRRYGFLQVTALIHGGSPVEDLEIERCERYNADTLQLEPEYRKMMGGLPTC